MTNTLRKPLPAPTRTYADFRSDFKAEAAARTEAWQAHREQIEAGKSIPTIVVSNRQTKIRFLGACQFCHGSMFDLHVPPTDLEHPHVSVRGTVACLLCGRDVAILVFGNGQPKTLTCRCGRQYPRYGECRVCRDREVKRRAVAAYRARQRALKGVGQ